jgi:hypothetical protein
VASSQVEREEWVSYGRLGRTARFKRSRKKMIFKMKRGIRNSSDFPSS